MTFSAAYTSHILGDRYIPVQLSTPVCRLGGALPYKLRIDFEFSARVITGHRSIVNSTLMHPTMPYLVTSGIERHVTLHCPVSSSPCAEDLFRTPDLVRALPEPNLEDRRLYVESLISERRLGNEDDEDDKDTIALFDEWVGFIAFFASHVLISIDSRILRQEGTTDVFEVRRWYPSSDEDSDYNDEVAF